MKSKMVLLSGLFFASIAHSEGWIVFTKDNVLSTSIILEVSFTQNGLSASTIKSISSSQIEKINQIKKIVFNGKINEKIDRKIIKKQSDGIITGLTKRDRLVFEETGNFLINNAYMLNGINSFKYYIPKTDSFSHLNEFSFKVFDENNRFIGSVSSESTSSGNENKNGLEMIFKTKWVSIPLSNTYRIQIFYPGKWILEIE